MAGRKRILGATLALRWIEVSQRILQALGAFGKTIHLPKPDIKLRAPSTVSTITQLLKRSTNDLYKAQFCRQNAPEHFLHDGPPYANGSLHMGHALNKILKDMINRVAVQSGKRVHYVPGWDCHGLPIELKALEALGGADKGIEKGKTMTALEIRNAARKLANATVESQMSTFRSWAIMGDWANAYKTMETGYEVRQLNVFKQMAEKELIYRRFKPVYWSPSSGTALAEAELEYNEKHTSKQAYVKFRISA